MVLGDIAAPVTCAVGWCTRPVRPGCRGWCKPCWARWDRAGRPPEGPPPPTPPGECNAAWRADLAAEAEARAVTVTGAVARGYTLAWAARAAGVSVRTARGYVSEHKRRATP